MKSKVMTAATIVFLIVGALYSVLPQSALAGQKSAYVEKGRKLFKQYCATCHGVTGKGDGPVGAALKIAPPDLTSIQKPGEKFPFDHVQTKIDGEKEVTAHGTNKMPVWGTIFRRTQGDLQRHADVYSLAKYIESIQKVK
jgi:mono/diheme cytochrome c family protein